MRSWTCLRAGARLGVAIARAMQFKSKVMTLEETTNHLSVDETNKVIGLVPSLAEQGVTAILIGHNMHCVSVCCDRPVAVALGEVVLGRKVMETSIDEVHEML